MLWTPSQQFLPFAFDKEVDLESAIAEVQNELLGGSRICSAPHLSSGHELSAVAELLFDLARCPIPER
jgi:hypothetical protein